MENQVEIEMEVEFTWEVALHYSMQRRNLHSLQHYGPKFLICF